MMGTIKHPGRGGARHGARNAISKARIPRPSHSAKRFELEAIHRASQRGLPVLGLRVHLPDTCDCGGSTALIGADSALHLAELRCDSCDAYRGSMARVTYGFIAQIIDNFGRPTVPIVIRRSERSINSGSKPESALAASPAYDQEYILMRKSDIFPSTYYNAADVREGAILLTIDDVKLEPVGEGTNKTDKAVAYFEEEGAKLLVVSPTKFDAIALIAKNDDTNDWPGTKIVLEAGKTTFQGRLVDSVAIRAPRKPPSPPKLPPTGPTAPVAGAEADLNDEVPF
jgi:hypothetical protein